MVLWVKSPRVASSDCASNPMPILIRLKAPCEALDKRRRPFHG